MIFATVATILLCTLPGYIPGESAWYVSQGADGLVITLWVYQAFKLTPDIEFDRKFFMSAVLAVCAVNNVVYPLWVFNPCYGCVAYPLWVFAVGLLLFRVKRRNYKYDSDTVDSKMVTLCFWRPKKPGSYFHSFVGAPVASIAIYASGHLWSYRWGQPGFTRRPVTDEYVRNRYITVDTGTVATGHIVAVLYGLVGTPARQFKTLGFRASCVLTIAPVLKELGDNYKPRFLEFLPSLYAGRILNARPKNYT